MINSVSFQTPSLTNNTGIFSYSGPSFDKGVPDYKMIGTIRAVNQPLSTPFNGTNGTTSSSTPSAAAITTKNANTITTLMVPANQLGVCVAGVQHLVPRLLQFNQQAIWATPAI